jgi:regulator of protease activity HflC (stomatin/prohibitin superfamily)
MLPVVLGTGPILLLLLILAARSIRQIEQYELGIVSRYGKVLPQTREPGLTWIWPVGYRLQKVNMQIVAMKIPAKDGITRDNISIKAEGVVYFKVVDPIKAVVNVQNYMWAISQQSQASLRSIVGQFDLDQLLAERDTLNKRLGEIIGEAAEADWGVRVERVEVSDLSLSEGMRQLMSRQDDAERKRQAQVIVADDEYQVPVHSGAAAKVTPSDPATLKPRPLFTPNTMTKDDREIWSIA